LCSTRAATGRSHAAAEHHKPPGTTRHGKRDRTWLSRVAQGVKNTLARDDHVPITGEPFNRSKQWLNQRTAASKVGGYVSARGRRNSANLASKNDKKTEARQVFRRHERRALPLHNLSGVFSCKNKGNLKKLKNHTNLHSPKGLGGQKPPPKQVRGDSKLHSLSGWETLASTGTS